MTNPPLLEAIRTGRIVAIMAWDEAADWLDEEADASAPDVPYTEVSGWHRAAEHLRRNNPYREGVPR